MWRAYLDRVQSSYRALEDSSPGNRLFRKQAKELQDQPPALKWLEEDAVPEWLGLQHETINYGLLQLLLPVTILRLCDMFIGPKSLAPYAGATLAIHLLYAVSRRQLPHVPLLVLTALAMMPPAISGSFTRLFSCWLWVQSLYIPFVDHLQDDISDRDQVRLLLVGALLSGFFSIVAEAMAHYKTFRGILAINIGAAIAVLLRALVVSNEEPWLWIRYRPAEEPGKVVRHRVVWAAEQIVLYATRMLLILANRAAKSLMRVLGQPSGGIHGSSRNQPEEKYQYRHLIGTQIRLLRVFPGLPSEPIRCRLETVALGTAPPFEAVSYVWGSADLVRFVVIDNDGEGDDESTRLDVTDSAYSIIARRRSRWHERLLWIDGLCIDQENLDERASQVQMMGALYANARRVVAWLGPCSTAHVVQSFLAQLRYKKEGLGYSVEQLKDATADPMGPQWLALSDFFLNPWFTRMWIVQEVALSKELHLLYGDVCMDWDVVRQSLSILMGKHMMGNFPQMDGSFFSKERQRIFRGLCNVDVMLELRGDVDCSRDLTLATALECALEFECKDERDKIYALLSLMESSTLTPDYRIDFQALYVDAMWEILLQATSLDAMEFAGTGRARRAANLPSWVPDWDGGSTNGPYHVSSYSAGTDHAAAVVLDRENPLVVSVQGWERDRVELLGDALEMGGETTAVENNRILRGRYRPAELMAMEGAVEDNRTLRGWYKAAECMAMECAAHYPEEGSTRLEMFVRTVLGDRISDLDHRPSTIECLEAYEALHEHFSLFEVARAASMRLDCRAMQRRLRNTAAWNRDSIEPEMYRAIQHITSGIDADSTNVDRDMEDIVQRFDRASVAASPFFRSSLGVVYQNRFCVTANGRMAIVPPDSRKGDIICVMKGARMPVLLRPKSRLASEGFELVGCCYVHGLMDRGWTDAPAEPFLLI